MAVGGEGAALDAIWVFVAFLLLIVLAAVVLAARRFLLERGGGTVECGLRSPAGRGSWRLGVVSYQGDELSWYDTLGVLLRPEQVFHRRQLTILSRRPSLPSEAGALGAEQVVVEIGTRPPGAPGAPGQPGAPGPPGALGPGERPDHRGGQEEAADGHVELAMTEQALTGFLAWLEASPPGSHLEDIS